MISAAFLGRRPSNFKLNPIVQGFIISEMFFWSGWNLANPIFAIFIANHISDGSVEAAGTAATIYLISRIMVELVSSRVLNQVTDKTRYLISIVGVIGVGILYWAYSLATNLIGVYVIQALMGIAFGIVSPAKLALFSEHLDKGRESTEWGLYDAITLSGMALTAMLGGFVAEQYGFGVLFFFSAIMIWLGAIPFSVFYLTNRNG